MAGTEHGRRDRAKYRPILRCVKSTQLNEALQFRSMLTGWLGTHTIGDEYVRIARMLLMHPSIYIM